jgi:hypothetical protein
MTWSSRKHVSVCIAQLGYFAQWDCIQEQIDWSARQHQPYIPQTLGIMLRGEAGCLGTRYADPSTEIIIKTPTWVILIGERPIKDP